MTASTTECVDTRDMIVVHTAFRREFCLAPGLVCDTPVGDVSRASLVAAHLELINGFLHLHHTGEDRLVWPKLLDRVPKELAPAVTLMQTQHERIHDLIESAEVLLLRWRNRAEAAERDELADVLDQLLDRSALPGDDVRVVVGRDERAARLGDDRVRGRLALVGGDPHQARPERRHRLDLRGDGVVGHDDGRRDPQPGGGPGQGPAVVARRVRHEARGPHLRVEAGRRVERPAQLEGTDRLRVLPLEQQARHRCQRLDGGAHRDPVEYRGRGVDGRAGHEGRPRWSSSAALRLRIAHPCSRRTAARPGGSPESGGTESGSTVAGPGAPSSRSSATQSVAGPVSPVPATAERLTRA
ncbi:MAG: hypothetical protein QOE41_4333, partial [Mycobacterium sp.]|nr:hypothetical protein [Mycobacterium sp.]